MSKQSPTKNSWMMMRQRCNNPAFTYYANYGGRGIRVCSRWDSFDMFVRDMGPRPEGTTLDRIDSQGHYEPGNCRWASAKTQANNRRSNRQLTAHGKTMNLSEWATELGVSKQAIRKRIALGWNLERALNSSVRRAA